MRDKYTPPEAEGWVAPQEASPDDQPTAPRQINRRALLKGLGLLAAAEVARRVLKDPENKQEGLPEKPSQPERPALTVESLNKEFQLSPEETELVNELANDIPLESIRKILGLEPAVKDEKKREDWLGYAVGLGVHGMEKLGIESREFRQLTIDRYPKGLFFTLHEIEYVDQTIPMPKSYGAHVGASEAAHADTSAGKITISRGQINDPVEVMHNIRHEVGHFLDPNANRILTRTERLELKKALVDRIKLSNRFSSDYVNAINNTDKKIDTDIKSTEYVAEIFGHYLGGNFDSTFGPEDERILKQLFNKLDPNFDIKKALKIEDEAVRKWSKAQIKKK